jgi:tetratricopeptide (TPR) repeat protein
LRLQTGIAFLGQGQLARARAELDQALVLARASFSQTLVVNDDALGMIKQARELIAAASERLADCAVCANDPAGARQHAFTACELYVDLGGARNAIRANTLRGGQLQDYPNGSLKESKRAVDRARAIGDRVLEVTALVKLGESEMELGHRAQARALFGQALEKATSLGNAPLRLAILSNLARAAELLRDPSAMLAHSQAALLLADQLGARHAKEIALTCWGEAHRALGHSDEAQVAEQSLSRLRQESSAPPTRSPRTKRLKRET